MIGIPYGLDTTNSPFGRASCSWTLPSNNSSPCGRLENPTNIVDLLNFPIWPLMNLIGNEALWLDPVCQLGHQYVVSSQKSMVTPKGYNTTLPTNTS
jgi:hypothetical protein